MNKKIFYKGKVSITKDNGKITVIASDETLDRHGDVLPIDQWDLTKFKQAPRMLIDHNHTVEAIVGKWDNTRIEGGKLLMDANFHRITELSKAVEEMVQQSYLDTVSVGFIYNDPTSDGGRPSFELIETSWVTVPANPSARVVKGLMDKGIPEVQKKEVLDFAGDVEESDEVLPEDDDDQPLADEIEDGEPEVIPSEEPVADDKSMESMEKAGWLVVRSVDDFNEWQAKHADGHVLTLVDSIFLQKLLTQSEQHKILTEKNQARVEADKNAKLARLAMKEAAGLISHSLRELNKLD